MYHPILSFAILFSRILVFAQVPGNYSPIYPVNKTLTRVTINDDFYGTRNVSYWVTSNGLAVIDGDVVYGTVEDLIQQIVQNSTARNDKIKRAFSESDTWPNAVVTYKYNSDATERLVSSIVNQAIDNWHVGAPYITFTQTTPNGPDPINGVVTISADDCDGCHASQIGFAATSPLFMNLQQGCPGHEGWCQAGEATHEFGHVLGLVHEHERPDRENYVHFQCENLDPTCKAGFSLPAGGNCCSPAPNCCAHLGDFEILTSPTFDWSGPYDINSTMEYRADAFALPGTDTLTSARVEIVVPTENIGFPSPLDFERICKIYAPWCPRAQACAATRCPVRCEHILVCDGDRRCITGPFQICCEGRELNAQCDAKRRACSAQNCDFLL